MEIFRYPAKGTWPGLLKRPVMDNRTVDSVVIPIIQDVQKRGDEALLEYTTKFDKVNLTSLKVSVAEFDEADRLTNPELKDAISMAVRHIEKFHNAQKTKVTKIKTAEGVECWQKSVAIQKVGLYIPGGSAPLFSTVLMLAIPARIAGCQDIVLCSPPDKSGKIHHAVLYAAKVSGITQVFKIGGSQAIAAMAYGTKTVPRVYKIFGPGNQYVTAAKQLVSRNEVAIDMPAGPSELAVIADESSNPEFVASDLLSQAEHGIDSQVLMVTTDEKKTEATLTEIKKQVQVLPRKDTALESLKNSRFIILRDMKEVLELINEYAPEHLIIATNNAAELAEEVINAGSVFIGHYASESAGDYASGTNHTLPTNGYAKAYNGVNLDDFVKKITFQQITPEGLQNIGPAIMTMAEAESLMGHKNSVFIRIKK